MGGRVGPRRRIFLRTPIWGGGVYGHEGIAYTRVTEWPLGAFPALRNDNTLLQKLYLVSQIAGDFN